MMTRALSIGLALALSAHAAFGQEGPLKRAGRALDNAGRNIRDKVEGEVTRAQITAQERDLLGRVSQRLTYDKHMLGSVLQLTVRADGAVILQGSVASESAKKRAVDLAETTVGVTAVADELAVVKDVKIIQPAQVIISPPASVVVPRVVVPPPVVVPPQTRSVVVPPAVEVVVPPESKAIVKP